MGVEEFLDMQRKKIKRAQNQKNLWRDKSFLFHL